MRICSLLPGATEVVAALGLADDLVGISHECDFPPEVRNKPVLVHATIDSDHLTSPDIDRDVRERLASGHALYHLDGELFRGLRPDLVLTQDLCQVCAITPGEVRRAMQALPDPPQLLELNPTTYGQVLADVESIGAATGRLPESHALAERLRAETRRIEARVERARARPRVACLEWLDPFFVAGHWVPEMVALAGGTDVLGTPGAPSRTITWDELSGAAPEVLVLMPCGFSVPRTLRELERGSASVGWQAIPAVKEGRVFAVDAGSYFSRPGPRLVEGVGILATVFHPSLFPDAHADRATRVDLLATHRS